MATKLHFSPRPNRAAEIRWHEWNSESFERAQAEHKPVLLAISAVWCHWCHVMDETSYSDGNVIELINEKFVPIRVDNDQRPDINTRYNMGGWPTTVILTPEGEVLRGGTYIPPEAMRPFLQQVSDLYAEPANRLEFSRRIAEIKAKRAEPIPAPSGKLDTDAPRAVVTALSDAFDDDYGGFGNEPKFPHTDALHFLLDEWTRSRDGRAQTMVQMSLRAMAGGGMYDHVEGGFFRYSTTRDFSVPHFEKMLEDLAELLLACARARVLFGDAALGRVATDVRRYLDDKLWNPDYQAYGGSQDADEEYYALDAAERAKRKAPYVDPTLYTSWNAQAARALIISGPLLAADGVDTAAWIARGLEILDSLWSRALVDGLMARYFDGAAHVRGLLSDQAWAAWAALAAFSATGDEVWLSRARDLLGQADALWDEAGSSYVDRLRDSGEPGRLGEPVAPVPENALMARALLALAAFTGEQRHGERARAILKRFASSIKTMGLFAASYASAVLDALEPPLDVKIVGSQDADATRALRDRARTLAAPALRINTIDPRASARLRALDVEPSNGAVAYVCREASCFARATSADALRDALERTERPESAFRVSN